MARRSVGARHAAPLQEPRHLRAALAAVLALGLAHTLLYVALFPPWQHYDEPSHFEYVRLIAERGRLPRIGDYDLAMRREIAVSMLHADFWKGQAAPVFDLSSAEPPNIGVSELYHPPLYYALLALPQLLVAHQPVEIQLYVARLTSALLVLVVLGAVYGLVAEIFPRRKWLPVAVAAFVALLPPFIDLMSSVNSDAGAAAATSLFLWAAARLVRRGPALRRAVAVALLAGICVAVKNTAGIVAVPVAASLALSYVPRPRRRWLWLGLAVAVPSVLVASFSWQGHAAHWISDDPTGAYNRLTLPAAPPATDLTKDSAAAQSQTEIPMGKAVFALSGVDGRFPHIILQELNLEVGRGLRGHTITWGAWMRSAGGSGGFAGLLLDDGPQSSWHRVTVTADWRFYGFVDSISADAAGVAVSAVIPRREGAAATVYVDGLVLVDGALPASAPPQFDTAAANVVVWGGQRLPNLLQNGSAEQGLPGLRPWAGNLALFRAPMARILQSLWEWPHTHWVYSGEVSTLFQSFWGGFGWNHIRLATLYFYPLAGISVLSVAGAGVGLVRRRRGAAPRHWRALAMLVVALAVGWGGALLRIHPVFVTRHISWPVARYADPVIAATAVLLVAGLAELVPRRWLKGASWAGLVAMIALDALALWTVILPYYY